ELHCDRGTVNLGRKFAIRAAAVSIALAGTSLAAPNWQATLTKDPPGNFPELRPVHTTYHFGWSGITAGKGDMHFTKIAGNRFQLEATGGTTGFVRALWKLDATYHGTANAETLRPIESEQVEAYRHKKITTDLSFTDAGVNRTRTESPGSNDAKPKLFTFPGLFDLHGAMLYLRSQPLKDHSVYRIVVYPATSAYFATITVQGREHVSVHAGSYNAIKLGVELKRLGKDMELEPHRKFRHATVWVSDDENRIPLRIAAQIFVGTVFAELYAVHFD
ncbi:MAG TPA: DUF3108 domain-containing protein, partial [Chthoniobacterales bacterium]|nr:DUF3108 domain-containing protein [Chthoniobacterales bacterium]